MDRRRPYCKYYFVFLVLPAFNVTCGQDDPCTAADEQKYDPQRDIAVIACLHCL